MTIKKEKLSKPGSFSVLLLGYSVGGLSRIVGTTSTNLGTIFTLQFSFKGFL